MSLRMLELIRRRDQGTLDAVSGLFIYMNKYVCMYVCMPFYVVHYHNNLMKAHHYHKSHRIPSDILEKMNIIILMFK